MCLQIYGIILRLPNFWGIIFCGHQHHFSLLFGDWAGNKPALPAFLATEDGYDRREGGLLLVVKMHPDVGKITSSMSSELYRGCSSDDIEDAVAATTGMYFRRHWGSPYTASAITIHGISYHHTRHQLSPYMASAITIHGISYHHTWHQQTSYLASANIIFGIGKHHV